MLLILAKYCETFQAIMRALTDILYTKGLLRKGINSACNLANAGEVEKAL